MSGTMCSPNFEFLKDDNELLYEYAMRAERYVFDDPNTCLFKLRQFSEYMTQQVAIAFGLDIEERKHVDLINDLYHERIFSPEISQMTHSLRKEGNSAVHAHSFSEMRNALQQLKIAHKLACWYQKTVNDSRFKFTPFVPPPNPGDAEELLKSELEELRNTLIESQQQIKLKEQAFETQTRLRAEAEGAAAKAYEELNAALELAEETESERTAKEKEYSEQIEKLKAQAASRSSEDKAALLQQAQTASAEVEKDEQMTRILIDEQLRDHGWEVDTQYLRYSKGTRPQKNRNVAIAEWPTKSGPADYVLFCGLQAVAIIEAKREMKNISGDIKQAKRYSRTFTQTDDIELLGPWGDMQVPFLFATNGRPYQEQYKQMSGTWFLDCRKSTNHPRAFDGWYTPEGIKQLLRQNTEEADRQLSFEENNLPLRDYQKEAVKAVEEAIAEGRREIMLAMATGTGKTRTCIGLVYRLIKTRRFRRVLFLVDRTSLGEQALNAFKDLKLDNQQTFNDIFDIKGLEEKEPEETTRLHITTVQGVMQRLLYPTKGSLPLPVDMYDCIVVDECHRGYNLDKEMSELEVDFRNETDYISKYRRVIDHFDAVKIGLTATPALHTTDIFGMPVYHYSYRQAVIDGYLVDQEVPIAIETELAKQGISYEVGDEVLVYDYKKKQTDSFKAPDELNYDIEKFNKTVITKNFNKVVCEELTNYISFSEPGKTLVFCATDDHADMVVNLLKKAYKKSIGAVEDDAIVKITGRSDKPNSLIKHYKNENLPKIAVTVDLLTTGIDVPSIVNLVFLRRVRSRILYDQMIGRATRLCEEISKESFRIFDAVELYKHMSDHTDMKPVVTKTSVSFSQLAQEMIDLEDELSLKLVRDQYCAKFHRVKKKLLDNHSESFELTADMSVQNFISTLTHSDSPQIKCLAETCMKVAKFIESLPLSNGRKVVISKHKDTVIGVRRGYGSGMKPEDYLESFREYLKANMNKIAALKIIAQKPRDLTRKELKDLQILLAGEGFSEKFLKTAWKDAKHEDIAASIIGFIRAMTIGSPLLSYEQRLENAMQKIYKSRQWTLAQEEWLNRFKKTLAEEKIVDKDCLNTGSYRMEGGFNRINKTFDGELDKILHDINEAIWAG